MLVLDGTPTKVIPMATSFDARPADFQATPWWGNQALAESAYNALRSQVGGSPTDRFAFGLSGATVQAVGQAGFTYSSPTIQTRVYWFLAEPNQPPVAGTGQDQTVASGATVTLSSAGSADPDGDPLAYTWTQLSGPSVTLSNSSAAAPSFTAPSLPPNTSGEVLVFQLVVNDRFADSAPVTVSVTVEAPVDTTPPRPQLRLPAIRSHPGRALHRQRHLLRAGHRVLDRRHHSLERRRLERLRQQ